MVKREEIRRVEKSLPVFADKVRWQTVESQDSVAAIHRALDDSIRVTIFRILDEGPIRQIDLAKLVNEASGKSYDVSSILHHLELLEKAGLVASEEFPGKQTKVKMIYRIRDVRLQVYERPKLDVSPTSADEVEGQLLDLRRKTP
jgi:DNA-binding transcriptional ArsR family regulator